jgi:serine phosphatase RsbU (regulator of sigma subunit)/GAF domain-containing protein
MGPPLAALAEKNPLFGGFIRREGVASCARFLHHKGDRVQAILFVNFREPTTFAEGLQLRMQRVMQDLGKHVSNIIEELATRRFPSHQLVRILQATQQLVALGLHNPRDLLEEYFRLILDAAFDAFAFQPGEGLGTIHLFRPETRTLHLAAHRGCTAAPFPVQSVDRGEGIISWVALMRRSIVINDLATSNFRDMHVSVRKDLRSELAVPMLAGPELIGILNLECSRASAFDGENTRTIAYAASQAALAYRLYQQVRDNRDLAERTESLLQACHKATTHQGSVRSALNDLAKVACKFLEADKVDIWQYDPRQQRLTNAGASYSDFELKTGPRVAGWSHVVLQTKTPVWIGNIRNMGEFNVLYWDQESQSWQTKPPLEEPPREVNKRVVELDVHSALGIPILVRGECNGVAWLKYEDPAAILHSAKTMATATGFAAEAGLVMDSMQHHQELMRQKADEATRERIRKSYSPPGRQRLNGLDLYIISRPAESGIGGDCHAVVSLDEHTTGILLGDAAGHGINAAFNMISLVTTFRAFAAETRSATHFLERLHRIAHALDVQATVLYFIIAHVDGQRWLSGISAGHPQLMVLRGDQVLYFPDQNSPAHSVMLGFQAAPTMVEDRFLLEAGDVIIGYTDGVSEAGLNQRSGKHGFAKEGILASARSCAVQDPEAIARAIECDLDHHAGAALADDATIVVLRVS